MANKYHYQGSYSEEEENTGWNDFALRMFDRQTGRWAGADSYDQFASPYIGMGNDPVNNVDPSGGDIGDDFDFVDNSDFLSAFGPGYPHDIDLKSLSIDFGHCHCGDLAPPNQNGYFGLQTVVVTSPPVPFPKILWGQVKQAAQFAGGVLVGAGETALDVLEKSTLPLPAPNLLDPNHPTNPVTDLINGLNSGANFIAMLTDPTRKKQSAYFSNLYFNFKYATPFEAGKLGGDCRCGNCDEKS